MPVRTRRQRAQAPSHADLLNPLASAFTNVLSSHPEQRHLADGTIVHVAVSATGKGKHWRWEYPAGNASDNTQAVYSLPAPDLAYPTPPPSAGAMNSGQQQRVKFVTPASSMQQAPRDSIQNAPMKQEKHLPRAEGAPLVQKRPDISIPWENKLKASSPKGYWPKVGPTGHALGPHGTWLVDDKGEYIVHPLRKSPRVNKVGKKGMN